MNKLQFFFVIQRTKVGKIRMYMKQRFQKSPSYI